MTLEEKIKKLMKEIAEDEDLCSCVFGSPGDFFVVGEDSIVVMTEMGDSIRGGWFPDLVTGPTDEEDAYLQKVTIKYDIDECFFTDVLDEIEDFDEDDIEDFLEEDSLSIYRAIKKEVNAGKTPFKSMREFAIGLTRFGLGHGALYYEWEGEYFDLYESICEDGESIEGEELYTEHWLHVLENIRSCIAEPTECDDEEEEEEDDD